MGLGRHRLVSQWSGEDIPARSRPGGRTGEAAGGSASRGHKHRRRKRRGRLVAVALLLPVLVVCVLTARLFIWPDQGMPDRVSAIVMLNGPGDRLETAENLAWEHRASFVVISRGSQYWGHGSNCFPAIPHVTVICFDPNPATTQGEAEFVGRLARKYGWTSVALVTVTPQDTRARLRLERCLSGPVYAVTTSLPLTSWPYEIAYEWGATVKALVFQRGC